MGDDLFDAAAQERSQALDRAVDAIRGQFGNGREHHRQAARFGDRVHVVLA